jgi:lysophospholipase L1-like esterase
MRVLTVGDSITAAGQWQAELARIAQRDAGVTLDIRNVAVAGTRTDYWPDRVAGPLAEHDPDLVTFFSGTNDDINATKYGESATSWSWRYVVEACLASGAAVLPALIGYSDRGVVPQWLIDSQKPTNDRIYSQYSRYASRLAGLVNFQTIPGDAQYLDDGGVHPTAYGYRVMGRLVYDALYVRMGWPPCSDPPIRGLFGHARGEPRPNWLPWPCGAAT